MSMLFHMQVYAGGVSGGTTYYTPSELNPVLGQADVLSFQTRISMWGGTTPAVKVTLEYSNTGAEGEWKSGPIVCTSTQGTAGGVAANVFGDTSGTTLQGLVRLAISVTGSAPVAYVEIWATGRTLGA